MDVVCGRAPHVEEWIPLDTEGDLRMSLDYDTVEDIPAPGDSVSLLSLDLSDESEAVAGLD